MAAFLNSFGIQRKHGIEAVEHYGFDTHLLLCTCVDES